MDFLQINSKGQLRLSHRALLEEQNDGKATEAKLQEKDKEAKKDGRKQERKRDEKKEPRRQSPTRSDVYIVSKDSSQ